MCVHCSLYYIRMCTWTLISGFPDHINLEEFEKRWLSLKDMEPLPMTLLAALFHSEEEVRTNEL